MVKGSLFSRGFTRDIAFTQPSASSRYPVTRRLESSTAWPKTDVAEMAMARRLQVGLTKNRGGWNGAGALVTIATGARVLFATSL